MAHTVSRSIVAVEAVTLLLPVTLISLWSLSLVPYSSIAELDFIGLGMTLVFFVCFIAVDPGNWEPRFYALRRDGDV